MNRAVAGKTDSKPVAVEKDVKPKAGQKPFDDLAEGEWKSKDLKEEKHDTIHIDEMPVILSAKCTFYYKNGKKPDGTVIPYIGEHKLALKPGAEKGTVLTLGGKSVLVSGDTVSDEYGNKLVVETSTNRLKTQ